MSLLQKASIITTPTAYAEDYLYSIKPAYALGSELVTNGNFATDSDWGKGSGWTISGGKANRSGESGNSPITQNVPVVNGRKYTFSYTRKYLSGSSGHTNIFVKLDNVNYSTIGAYISTVVEEHIVTGEFTALFTGNLLWQIYGIGDFTGYVDNVSIKEVTDADFDFDRNSTGTRVNEDYLIEDVPYNFIPYSQDFSNSNWRKRTSDSTQVPVITDNYALAPDGTLTASRVVVTKPNTENDFAVIDNFQSVSKSVGSKFTNSVFLKASDSAQVGKIVNVYSYDADYMSFVTHTLTDYWVRITAVATATSTTGNTETIVIGKARSSGGGTSLANMSTDFLVWGAQLVKGDQPKDYLKTTDRLDIPRIDYTNGEPSILLEPQVDRI